GVSMFDIAVVVGAGLGVPVVSLSPEAAMDHFGWLAMFAGLDMPASSKWTCERLGWQPTGPSLIADLSACAYRPAAAWSETRDQHRCTLHAGDLVPRRRSEVKLR